MISKRIIYLLLITVHVNYNKQKKRKISPLKTLLGVKKQ